MMSMAYSLMPAEELELAVMSTGSFEEGQDYARMLSASRGRKEKEAKDREGEGGPVETVERFIVPDGARMGYRSLLNFGESDFEFGTAGSANNPSTAGSSSSSSGSAGSANTGVGDM